VHRRKRDHGPPPLLIAGRPPIASIFALLRSFLAASKVCSRTSPRQRRHTRLRPPKPDRSHPERTPRSVDRLTWELLYKGSDACFFLTSTTERFQWPQKFASLKTAKPPATSPQLTISGVQPPVALRFRGSSNVSERAPTSCARSSSSRIPFTSPRAISPAATRR